MRCTAAENRHRAMRETVVRTVGDRAIVVERREHPPDRRQYVAGAVDVEERFLLAREGGVPGRSSAVAEERTANEVSLELSFISN